MKQFFGKIIQTIGFLIIAHLAFGAKVGPVVIYSSAMGKNIKDVIVTLYKYSTPDKLAVVH